MQVQFSFARSSKTFDFNIDEGEDLDTVFTQFNVEHSELNTDNLFTKTMNGFTYPANKRVSYLYFRKIMMALPQDFKVNMDNLLIFPLKTTPRYLKKLGVVTNQYEIENHLVVIFEKLEHKQSSHEPNENETLSYQELSDRYTALVNGNEHMRNTIFTHVDAIDLKGNIDNNFDYLEKLANHIPNLDQMDSNARYLEIKNIMQLAYISNSWVQNFTHRDMKQLLYLIKTIATIES